MPSNPLSEQHLWVEIGFAISNFLWLRCSNGRSRNQVSHPCRMVVGRGCRGWGQTTKMLPIYRHCSQMQLGRNEVGYMGNNEHYTIPYLYPYTLATLKLITIISSVPFIASKQSDCNLHQKIVISNPSLAEGLLMQHYDITFI